MAWFRLLAVLGVVLAARSAAGQAPAAPSLRVSVVADGAAGFEPERMRARLEAEIGRSVTLAAAPAPASGGAVVTITYRAAANELTVSYAAPGAEPVIRTISPGAGEDAADVAVLLAGNLVRDQASELLAVSPMSPAATEQTGDASATPADLIARTATSQVSPSSGLDRLHLEGWFGNLGLANVGLRYSGRRAYGALYAAGHREDGRRMVGSGFAVGVHFPVRSFEVEGDLGTTFLYGLDWPPLPPPGVYTSTRFVSRARWAFVWSPLPRVAVFVGLSAAVITHLYGSGPDNEYGPEAFGGIRL